MKLFAKELPYKRVLLKLSGAALGGEDGFGINPKVVDRLSKEIKQISELGIELGIVVGGGNFFRGKELSETGLDRITADHMGMLATVMNSLAMRDALEKQGLTARVMSAIFVSGMVDAYNVRKASYNLADGKIMLFAAGTGNPLVTTDSAASLRAIELKADLLLKATDVDGVYSADPKLGNNINEAIKYDRLTYDKVLKEELEVMDLASFYQCRKYAMKIRVFNVNKPGSLLRAVTGSDEGTLVEGRDKGAL